MEHTLGYGVTASSGGMTTPSTSVAGMPGYVAPPLGLTPPDFSSWSLPPPEAPLSQGLPAAPQDLSHVGRSIQVRAVAERQAWAQLAQYPRGLVQPAQHSPWWYHAPLRWCHLSVSHHLGGRLLSTSRRYSRLARPPGGESRSTPSTDKTAPVGGPSSQDRGRPTTREWGDGGRSVSHPRGCRRRQVRSRHVRRAICPLGQCQVFHHQRHLKEPCLSQEVSQGPPTMIPRDWQQNSVAWGGRRTLSMCSGSTTIQHCLL